MEKEIRIPKWIYEYPDEIAKELTENKVGKVEYICLRLAWRTTERELPKQREPLLFVTTRKDEEGKTALDEILTGCYEAPHEELDEYGDDGEGFYADQNGRYSKEEVIGWAYLADLVPGLKDEEDRAARREPQAQGRVHGIMETTKERTIWNNCQELSTSTERI